jgi:hypothetical protein
MNNTFTMGSRHINPITWAVSGSGVSPTRMVRFQWYTVYSLIDYYTCKYEQSCHCIPVSLYQQKNGRENIKVLVDDSPKHHVNNNVVMAAAISFMYDVIKNVGPDTTEFFDIFTNDLRVDPNKVDIALWLHAREKALNVTSVIKEESVSLKKEEAPFQKSYQPRTLNITVKITDKGYDLADGEKITHFQNIKKYSAEGDYWREYANL